MIFRSTAAGAAFVLLAATAASAQMPQMTRTDGRVRALSPTAIVVVKPDGALTTVPLSPTWLVRVSTRISPKDIQPGSYLGTTNYAKPDGTGTSLEVHVSPPGVKGPGVDFVMDAKAGTTMTNGVVGTVVESDAGRVLSVDYGHGVRKITVLPGVPIVLSTPGDRSMVKVGSKVEVLNISRPGGDIQMVSVEGQ